MPFAVNLIISWAASDGIQGGEQHMRVVAHKVSVVPDDLLLTRKIPCLILCLTIFSEISLIFYRCFTFYVCVHLFAADSMIVKHLWWTKWHCFRKLHQDNGSVNVQNAFTFLHCFISLIPDTQALGTSLGVILVWHHFNCIHSVSTEAWDRARCKSANGSLS